MRCGATDLQSPEVGPAGTFMNTTPTHEARLRLRCSRGSLGLELGVAITGYALIAGGLGDSSIQRAPVYRL